LCIWARARAVSGACRRCGVSSQQVHSRYERRLSDAAIGGQRPVIRLVVRRFFCGNPDCPNKTFAEQIDGLTSRRARRTPPLAQTLTAIALALAGRAGARLAALLGAYRRPVQPAAADHGAARSRARHGAGAGRG
jgi:hypothetical protein